MSTPEYSNKKLKIVNLFAGPGAGKSTTAAGLFYLMKIEGFSVELITEYAKEKVYEGHFGTLSDQIYIFGKQQRRAKKLIGHVEYAITDSPLMLSTLYNKDLSDSFEDLVYETYSSYENINFFINRCKPYVKIGREQDESEAIALDNKLIRLLSNWAIDYEKIDGLSTAPQTILDHIKGIR
jgi:hypothetical protein